MPGQRTEARPSPLRVFALLTDILQSILRRSDIGSGYHLFCTHVLVMGVRRHFWPMRRIIPSASDSSLTVLPMVGVFPGSIHKEVIFHEQLRSVMQRDESSEFVAGADATKPLNLHCLDNVSVSPRQLQQHASAPRFSVASSRQRPGRTSTP